MNEWFPTRITFKIIYKDFKENVVLKDFANIYGFLIHIILKAFCEH